MSLLQSILARAGKQYTCLVVPRLTALSRCSGLHVSQSVREQDKSSVEEVSASDRSSDGKGQLPTREVMYNTDMVPGNYFPTAAVYETKVDGVRFDELPLLYLTCTKNNTKAGAYRFDGAKTYDVQSGGTVGFKHTRKSTNVAAQAVGMTIGQNLMRKGVKNVRVIVRGTGAGRLPSIKGVQLSGVNIVSITDKTHPSFYTRPRKPPRK